MMKPLWAPWRMEFITSEKKEGCCVFCDLPKEKEDKKNLILYRGESVFVILNKFPYNLGHMMVVPYEHTNQFQTLKKEQLLEMMQETQRVMGVLTEVYRPEGFNTGMNLGQAVGAGIKEHLHFHIVPRWNGDTNFMPVLSETKGMPEHLQTCFEKCSESYRRKVK
ncbi:MAG: HIT family protein [Deltaproteobacteria bacterium]